MLISESTNRTICFQPAPKEAICEAVPPRSGSATPWSGRHPHLTPLSSRTQRGFNPFGALAAAALLLVFCGVGCETEDDANTDNGDCTEVGEAERCTCDNGLDGERFCLGDGTFTECFCSDRHSSRCSSPGAATSCACTGGGIGVRFCLRDGTYSPCDCSSASAGTGAPGSDSAAGSSGGGARGCPYGYNCVDMQGFQICVDSSGIPPFCATDTDCAAAGLSGAICTDPGVGTKVCVQLCG